MKVLHFSDSGLPDTRPERYGFVQKQLGYERIFVGGLVKGSVIKNSFDNYHKLKASRQVVLGLPYYYSNYKKNFFELYNEIKPDIVHCHNFLPAKVCYDLNIKYIYDDHEFWKEYVTDVKNRVKYNFTWRRKITTSRLASFVLKWEKKLAEKAFAVISVSTPIVDYYKTFNEKTYLIPNFPSSYEVSVQEKDNKSYDEISSLLVANYNSYTAKLSTDKIIELFSKNNKKLLVIGNVPKNFDNIEYLGYLSHDDYIKNLYRVHLGLIPLEENRQKSYHYIGSNRFFQYAHSGIVPIFHKEMTFLIEMFKENNFIITKEEDLIDLFDIIETKKDEIMNKSQNLIKYAKENFIFDHYKNQIKDIYEDCLKR